MPPKMKHTGHGENSKAFPVIGIGASAGGLEALQDFFGHLPAPSECAFVVIVHLPHDHISLLPELLRRQAEIPVLTIEDGMTIAPNHIYVVPPGKDLSVFKNCFQLLDAVQGPGLHLPIDFFLQALAREKQSSAGCVILSGTGSDGTQGLKAIKAEGGVALVQEEASARFSGMPHSAAGTGFADYIVPPSRMPELISQYFQHAFRLFTGEVGPASLISGEILHKIWAILRIRTGHDSSLYKKNTFLRRIERRLALQKIDDLSHYIKVLRQDPLEVDRLFQDILIGVTNFFRDPEAFAALENKILPKVLENFPEDQTFRVWVPACSSGEEADSIAIILKECIAALGREIPFQIFGTDADQRALEKARSGVYPTSIAADISPQRLQRYFVNEKKSYRVKKELREKIIFSVQNILQDPPFSKLDLLCCRNLLIYLEPEAQQKLLPLFHFSLRPGGILFLGNSESIGLFANLFTSLSKKWKIYKRREIVDLQRPLLDFSRHIQNAGAPPMARAMTADMKKDLNLADQTRKILLENFTPACVVINAKGEIFYIHGRTGKYLEPAAGRPRMNILDMARQGIRLELGTAIRMAVAAKKKVGRGPLRVKTNGKSQSVGLTVQPFPADRQADDLLLVIFEELADQESAGTKRSETKGWQKEQEKYVSELEQELQLVTENHQSTVEEYETSGEELRSMNEEMQSANEELQSTNEELEASREELQSMNEELMTVNAELQSKIDELSLVHDDMKNLLNSTRIATIFVDNDIRIKRFTPEAARIANLIDTDINRPLEDITTKLESQGLIADIRKVLDTLAGLKTEVVTKDGEWYQLNILPYRTTEDRIDGAVLTFSSIAAQKRAQQELMVLGKKIREQGWDFAKNIVDSLREALLILDEGLNVQLANPAFYKTFHLRPEETLHRSFWELDKIPWPKAELRKLFKTLAEKSALKDRRVLLNFPEKGKKEFALNARHLQSQDAKEHWIMLAIEEITHKKIPD